MDKFFIFIYFLNAIIISMYIYKAYKQKSKLGNLMGCMLIFALFIVLGYCLNLVTNNYTVMSFGNSFVFVSIDFMLITLLKYVLELTETKINKQFLLLCYAYAVIEGIFLITNPIHEFVLTYNVVYFYGNKILTYSPKLPFYIHLSFSYILIIIIAVLLVKKLLSVPGAYKKPFNTILHSLLFVVSINLVFLLSKEIMIIDLSIITYVMAIYIIYTYTFKYKPWLFIYEMQKMILFNIENPIILFDYNDKVVQFNKAFLDFFSLSEHEMLSITVSKFLAKNSIIIKDLSSTQNLEYNINRNGKNYYFQCKYQCIHDNKNKKTGVLITFNNITELKNANNKLELIVSHDQLTGLNNRYVFNSHMEEFNNEKLMPISIAVLNIDNLKSINEFFGTQFGDRVIECLADIIRKKTEGKYFSARFYGEDFIIVIPKATEKTAIDFVEEIQNEFNNTKVFDFDVNVEFGVATKTNANTTIFDIISVAREIMNNKKILKDSSLKSSMLESLKQSLIESDLETEEHVERTNELAIKLGKKLELSYNDLSKLSLLAILHDIGKIAIPSSILHKSEKLTEEEWNLMKQHTTSGYRIAKGYPELNEIANLILSHHERWDGNGYPNGLKEEEIPLLSRILSIVDAYDVMTNNRPYHQAISKKEAIEELKRCSGTQFNPEIVEIFIAMLEEEATELSFS